MQVGKKIKTIILGVLLCFLIWSQLIFISYGEDGAEGEVEPPQKLYAQSAVLLDGDTGRILFSKDSDVVRPMASTTKIMTCILALEQGNLDDMVTVSSYAASQPKVHLGAPTGRTFYLRDLLYSLMLESHNDTAVMIAEHVGGSVKGFADMMNEKARELGCENTYFITPNGLDATETGEDGETRVHSTTAADLARIMAYCAFQSPERERFLEITETQNYTFSDTEQKGTYSCVNHNALLTMMSHVVSGKTGFTGGAGYSYVGALDDGERRLTLALLGCGWPPHKNYKWTDAKALLSYGRDAYEKKEVSGRPALPELPVADGVPESGDLSRQASMPLAWMGEEEPMTVLLKKEEQVELRLELPKILKAPVKEGAQVGQLLYLLDGEILRKTPICAARQVDAVSMGWCLRHTAETFLP